MKKHLNLIALPITVVIAFTSLTGCTRTSSTSKTGSSYITDRETLFQVALLQSLTFGDYYGSITASELKKNGDIGLGTFDALDGEMIVLDGVVYKAKGDGSVQIVPDSEKIPFSNVTFFDTDEKIDLKNITDIAGLKAILNEMVRKNGENYFCIARIDGKFSKMNVRSEYSQKEPYKPLAKVLETDQTFFDFEDISGTVVALYCPPYMNSLNAPGWHLHFISSDRKKGGHILNLAVSDAELSLDYTKGFKMVLPDDKMFSAFDLTIDQTEDIKKVETNE